MAGSVTKTSVKLAGTNVSRHRLVWLSDASGVVSGNSVTLPAGTIVAVAFKPDAGGTQPTDLYDVVLNCDDHTLNVIDDGTGSASLGANLSNATSKHSVPFQGGGAVTYTRQWLHGGGYTLGVTNAGNAKGGTVDVYVNAGVI